MGRVALVILICALAAGALYVRQQRRDDQERIRPTTVSASRPVIADTGCPDRQSVVFDVKSATVGIPVAGKIGRHSACEEKDIEHMSGDVDWGDGTSSPLDTASAGPNTHDLIIAGQHVYTQSGRFPVFARLRAQCFDRGQSTRVISCGSGVIDVQ